MLPSTGGCRRVQFVLWAWACTGVLACSQAITSQPVTTCCSAPQMVARVILNKR